jgi:hypothetical protein
MDEDAEDDMLAEDVLAAVAAAQAEEAAKPKPSHKRFDQDDAADEQDPRLAIKPYQPVSGCAEPRVVGGCVPPFCALASERTCLQVPQLPACADRR